jgi:hypothetical protein
LNLLSSFNSFSLKPKTKQTTESMEKQINPELCYPEFISGSRSDAKAEMLKQVDSRLASHQHDIGAVRNDKCVKGFSSMNGSIWKVIENIRQRQSQNQNSKVKVQNDK